MGKFVIDVVRIPVLLKSVVDVVLFMIYVLIAIIKKRLKLHLSFYTILQIFSVAIFEQLPIKQVLTDSNIANQMANSCNQLVLFEL